MAAKRVTVADLAREAKLEIDEVLIELWNEGFDEVNGPSDALPRHMANTARRALGLATRRELASPEHWQKTLNLTEDEFWSLLDELGARRGTEAGRLTKKAI